MRRNMTELEKEKEGKVFLCVYMLENRGTQKESRDHQSVWIIIDTLECLLSFSQSPTFFKFQTNFLHNNIFQGRIFPIEIIPALTIIFNEVIPIDIHK